MWFGTSGFGVVGRAFGVGTPFDTWPSLPAAATPSANPYR
jgi:hypothetical protein